MAANVLLGKDLLWIGFFGATLAINKEMCSESEHSGTLLSMIDHAHLAYTILPAVSVGYLAQVTTSD